jgi:tetratricopeptide (TPR) repeat protein
LSKSQSIWIKLGVDGEQGLAEALRLMGLVAFSSEGNYTTAQAFFEKSLTLHRKHGNQWGMALVMAHLGWIAGGRNDEALALSLSEQSLDLFRQLVDLWGIGRVSQALGEFFLKQGNYEKARFFFEQHLRIDEGLHFKEGTVVALGNLGNLYRHQGDYDKAEQYYEQSLSMCREYSLKIDRGVNLYSLGMLALHRGKYSLAMQYFRDYFAIARESLEKLTTCDLLTASAAIAAGTNQPERAAKLCSAAQVLFETTDYRIPPFDRAEFDRHLQIARQQLGEERFEALAEEGRAMTIEQAVEYALESSTGG